MEFCGGHTHAIFRYGVEDLLPANVRLVHGPGCPVCVLAVPRLDAAIELAQHPDVTLVSYGDMLRVPASRRRSLLKARALGADVRMAYSALDALDIAAAAILSASGCILRHRLRDHDAGDRACHPRSAASRPAQLQRLLQPRGDPGGDPEHPRLARGP
jgi:hypothetical protein